MNNQVNTMSILNIMTNAQKLNAIHVALESNIQENERLIKTNTKHRLFQYTLLIISLNVLVHTRIYIRNITENVYLVLK